MKSINETIVTNCSHRAVRAKYHTVAIFEVLTVVVTLQIVATSPYKIIICIYIYIYIYTHTHTHKHTHTLI